MKPLRIEAKPKTPAIFFDNFSGVMEIKGMSCSENSVEFYKPVLAWIESYTQEPYPQTELVFFFKYFNTSSAKCILDLLEGFAAVQEAGSSLSIRWQYEDNDEQMQEAGEQFADILGIPFQMEAIAVAE